MISTTRRADDLLSFIEEYIGSRGIAPSFDEMMDNLGFRSKSGVHRLIEQLVERGRIRRLPNRARAIEVVKTEDARVQLEPAAWERLRAAALAHNVSPDVMASYIIERWS